MTANVYDSNEIDQKMGSLGNAMAVQQTWNSATTDAAKATDANVTELTGQVTELLARVSALEAGTGTGGGGSGGGGGGGWTPDPSLVMDVNFASGGNATLAGGQVTVNGNPAWQVFDNTNYGAGTGTKIQSWNKAANVTFTPEGLVLGAKLEAKTINGFNYPASACFLGTRDLGAASNATRFPVPLYFELTCEFTADGVVEDFDSLWLRHANGSGVGEIDFFETLSAQLTGEKGLQFGVPQLGLGQAASTILYRSRFNVPVGTKVKLVCTHRKISGTQAGLTVTMNGQKAYQAITGTTNTNPVLTEYLYDPTKLEQQTPDKAHAWDIAIQKHEGFDWGADCTKAYTGTLRNGSKGVPLAGATKSWAAKGNTSTVVYHTLKVKAL